MQAEKNANNVVTLYAQWEENTYTIDFIRNDPTVVNTANYTGKASGTMSAIANRPYDTNVTLQANQFDVEGWIFRGWATEETGTVVYEDGKTYKNLGAATKNGDIVPLYAVWEVDPYTVGKYVANGVVVSDTHGENSYTVYNDISKTPQLTCGGKVIVDWSSCLDGTHNYISAVNPTGENRYGGNDHLDIVYGITEVFFIGNPKATYTEVYIYTLNYPADSELTIHLKDMNLSSCSGIINSWYDGKGQDAGMYLTIDCLGTNTITLIGGNGGIGGSAIKCDNLYILNASQLALELTSGNGASGGKGEPSEAAHNNPYHSGDGGAGGRGGDGGAAIVALSITVEGHFQSLKVTLGSGGDGGNGGNGGDANKWWAQYSHPGKGGVGGTGGTAGVLGVDAELLPAERVVTVGSNGDNGNTGTTGASDAGPR